MWQYNLLWFFTNREQEKLTIQVVPNSLILTPLKSSDVVTLTAAGSSWVVSGEPTWLVVSQPSGGVGTHYIGLSVLNYPQTSQTATLTFRLLRDNTVNTTVTVYWVTYEYFYPTS